MKTISKSTLTNWQGTAFFLGLIMIFGLFIRVYYVPFEVPIVTDGYLSFVYAVKTVFDSSLPVGYTVTNSGWSNLLSLVFVSVDKMDPLYLMNVQRITSVVLSTITVIPMFFIFRKFVNVKFALLGSLMIAVEPRLLLISIEGINYTLFFFIFVLTIALFLKKTNVSLFFSFVCIAFLTAVRYEGILLVIPLSMIYLNKFRNKRSILLFLGMIFTMMIILLAIGELRIEATKDICDLNSFGDYTCGRNGYEGLFNSLEFLNRAIISEDTTSIIENMDTSHDEVLHMPSYSILDAFEKLFKFMGLILVPFFAFFVILNLISRIKIKKLLKWNFNFITILFSSGVFLLPALYAYVRNIDESRYLMVFIPLICILSISLSESIRNKISKDKRIFVVLILFIVITSIGFIEIKERDHIHDLESFKVSQEIVSLTDVTNSYNQDGYLKPAILFKHWPELPSSEADRGGKITNKQFFKISTVDYKNVEEFIESSRESKLEYMVVDEQNELFHDLRINSDEYPFLKKVFDSKNLKYTNEFKIFQIDYQIFDLTIQE